MLPKGHARRSINHVYCEGLATASVVWRQLTIDRDKGNNGVVHTSADLCTFLHLWWLRRLRLSRTSFAQQRGFSKSQRNLGERLLAARTPLKIYQVIDEVIELQALDAVSIATALNRLAKLQVDVCDRRFDSLLKQAFPMFSDMDARGLANSVRASAALALRGWPLLSLAATRVTCNEPSPQGPSSSAWAPASPALHGCLS